MITIITMVIKIILIILLMMVMILIMINNDNTNTNTNNNYTKVNGTFACDNGALLNGDLRGKLGFRGFVMSDMV